MNERSTLLDIRSAPRPRRGATILIVLLLISITLAFSFAMMRTQTASSQVQQNYDRSAQAKQAAMAGISIGMRSMTEPGWAGVGVDVNGSLSDSLSYLVSFETGDPTLTSGHPDEAEYPYRVTVTSRGTSTAPGDPSQQSSHTIRAVMQLVRRRMQPTPAIWSQVQPYTLYQWNADGGREVEIEMPARIEGPVAIQNDIALCEEYPGTGMGDALAGVVDRVTILGSALATDTIEDLYLGDITLADLLGESNSDPVASWRFDEAAGSQVAHDELGVHHGIYDGAVAGATADDGSGAATFDGVNDQVFLGPVGVYTGKITILARLKITAFGESMRIVSSSTPSATYWALGVDGPKRRLRFRVRSWLGSYEELVSPDDVIAPDQWIDVAAVYNGGALKLYLNGVLVGQRSMFGFLASSPAADLSIGSRSPGDARARYLQDLGAQAHSEDDQRPLDGPLEINSTVVSATTQALLTEELGISLGEIALPSGAPVAHPGQLTQYQLYPGGKVYPVAQLAGTLANTEIGPNQLTNPLGLFVCTDELRIDDNVTISGTILTYRDSTAGDVRIDGVNIELQAVDLPALVGATGRQQLPVAIISNDFEIESNSSGSLNGLAVTWDDFRLRRGGLDTDFQVNGKLIVSEIQLRKRNQWDNGSNWWNYRMSEFMRTINWQSPGTSHFPEWLAANRNLDSSPRFHARPATANIQYHWHDWSQPLFIPHPDDQGLRWELTDWKDNP